MFCWGFPAWQQLLPQPCGLFFCCLSTITVGPTIHDGLEPSFTGLATVLCGYGFAPYMECQINIPRHMYHTFAPSSARQSVQVLWASLFITPHRNLLTMSLPIPPPHIVTLSV